MGQIGPFIDMYIRRTVLNGCNPIKRSSRSIFLSSKFMIVTFRQEKIMIFLEFAGGGGV